MPLRFGLLFETLIEKMYRKTTKTESESHKYSADYVIIFFSQSFEFDNQQRNAVHFATTGSSALEYLCSPGKRTKFYHSIPKSIFA